MKLGTNRLWLEITHAMDMVLRHKHKGVVLKTAVPKKQTKSLKSTCEVVSFYYMCKLYTWKLVRTIFSQAFLQDFAKITCDFHLFRIVKNLIIYFAEAFQYFPHYQFTTLFLFLLRFWSRFFLETTSCGCFS